MSRDYLFIFMTESSLLGICKIFLYYSVFPSLPVSFVGCFYKDTLSLKYYVTEVKNPFYSLEKLCLLMYTCFFSTTLNHVPVCICTFFQGVHCSFLRLTVKALQSRSCLLATPSWLRTVLSRPFLSTPKRRTFSASATHMETSTSSR